MERAALGEPRARQDEPESRARRNRAVVRGLQERARYGLWRVALGLGGAALVGLGGAIGISVAVLVGSDRDDGLGAGLTLSLVALVVALVRMYLRRRDVLVVIVQQPSGWLRGKRRGSRIDRRPVEFRFNV